MDHHKDGEHRLAEQLKAFIRETAFPRVCVGAKSALSRDQLRIVTASDITTAFDVFMNVVVSEDGKLSV
jgi:hypothetical protein